MPQGSPFLTNPISPQEDPLFFSAQQAILKNIKTESGHNSLQDTRIKIGPLVNSGKWVLGLWLLEGGEFHPNGIAGQILLEQKGEEWLVLGSGNYLEDVPILMEMGVTHMAAEGLAAGADI